MVIGAFPSEGILYRCQGLRMGRESIAFASVTCPRVWAHHHRRQSESTAGKDTPKGYGGLGTSGADWQMVPFHTDGGAS